MSPPVVNGHKVATLVFDFVSHFHEEKHMLRKLFRNKKGQGLVEYGLIIAGVALICAAAISVFGHKVSDLIAATAAVLPGAHADDNGPIASGKLIETTAAGAAADIELDVTTIETNSATPRLGVNVGLDTPADFGGLVLEAD
jgi:Flp pilus assembly pilin Flp